MNFFFTCVAGLLAGTAGSLGLGGGGFLIIFLTVFMNTSQIKAQGINLIFFIPIAIFSVIIYYKDKLIDIKKIIPAVLTGLFGVILGSWLTGLLGDGILQKIFAVCLILLSIKEFFGKEKDVKSFGKKNSN
ncbi:MAG: hypothetical protein BGN88_02420 [Clostridiales bacterium 43-6]|nr:MAG: hypothetical protein BGN88_02420 [Clostridiales bacterium 43-6]